MEFSYFPEMYPNELLFSVFDMYRVEIEHLKLLASMFRTFCVRWLIK